MMFNSYEILHFNTCYCLTEVTACEGLTVVGLVQTCKFPTVKRCVCIAAVISPSIELVDKTFKT